MSSKKWRARKGSLITQRLTDFVAAPFRVRINIRRETHAGFYIVFASDHRERGNPCPERSEGSLGIATGFALATTSSDCHVVPLLAMTSYFVHLP